MTTECVNSVEKIIMTLTRVVWADVDLENKNSPEPRFERLTAIVALCRSFKLTGIETEIMEMLWEINLSAHKNYGRYNKM